MGRWTQYDEDDYRLPDGMKRVGYDADTQRYTFQRGNQSYVGEPGVRFPGALKKTGTAPDPEAGVEIQQDYSRRSDGYQPLSMQDGPVQIHSNKNAYRILLPYCLLVAVFLLFVWRFAIGHSAPPHHQQCIDGPNMTKYIVKQGDTCWDIARAHGISLDILRNETLNPGLNCDRLRPGDILCLPPN